MRYKPLFSLSICVLLLGYTKLFSQSGLKSDASMSKIIEIDSLFKCYGVIFDSSYIPPIEIHSIRQKFTPNETDVINAERILMEQYNTTNQATESRKGAKLLNDPKKYFRKFNRQYIGFIDEQGNRNLIIHLFDFSRKRLVKKYVGDSWKNKLVIVLAENPPFEIVTYRVNLTERKLHATF